MNGIKTSVIIPVYNTERYLKDCLDSVIRQSQRELEIIAIDDGSTDHSLDILRNFQSNYSNIYIYSQNNEKQGAARNVGIKCAKGEYIYFLDSDDYIDSETLETCYLCAKQNELDVVLFDSKVVLEGELPKDFCVDSFDRRKVIDDVESVYTGVEFLERYMNKKPDTVSPCMMYISKQFIEKNHLFFMPQVFYEDEEYRFKLMQKAQRLKYLPKLYYNRRYRYDSTMVAGYNVQRNIDLTKVIEQMVSDITDKTAKVLKHYIEMKMWMLLDRCNIMKKEKEEKELVDKIIHLLYLYWDKFELPGDIEDIKFRVYYIDYLKNIFKGYDWSEEQKNANDQRMILLKKVPLADKNLKIGIYGRPDLVDRLIWGYQNECGDVCAELFKLTGESQCGDDRTIDIDSIQVVQLNYILFVSGEKQDEVSNRIKKSISADTKILYLGDKDGNFLF